MGRFITGPNLENLKWVIFDWINGAVCWKRVVRGGRLIKKFARRSKRIRRECSPNFPEDARVARPGILLWFWRNRIRGREPYLRIRWRIWRLGFPMWFTCFIRKL